MFLMLFSSKHTPAIYPSIYPPWIDPQFARFANRNWHYYFALVALYLLSKEIQLVVPVRSCRQKALSQVVVVAFVMLLRSSLARRRALQAPNFWFVHYNATKVATFWSRKFKFYCPRCESQLAMTERISEWMMALRSKTNYIFRGNSFRDFRERSFSKILRKWRSGWFSEGHSRWLFTENGTNALHSQPPTLLLL